MLKRRKRGLRIRKQTTLLLLLIIIMLTVGPFLWHIERLRQAKLVYDIQEVNVELQWMERHGGLLNNLGLLRDTKLWLELIVGSKDLESKLAVYQDEEHRFWLFSLNLREGRLKPAQNSLDSLGNSELGQLGQGLMSLAKGDVQESRRLLSKTETDWEKLPLKEQTLRHLTLAQVAMIEGDYPSTLAELEAAQRLEPNNPACLSMAFDMAIGEGQWTKAFELSCSIDAQTWRPKNTLFETKKAVLAIHENNVQRLSDSLAALKELPQGISCINYVNGIEALNKGRLQEGKILLERALESGLDGGLKVDAQKALEQVTERQNADRILRSIVDEKVE